ncbi:hypothetical protein [Endothiovibrio diazotrophicus]
MKTPTSPVHPTPWLHSAHQELSDQATIEILDFLYELTTAFENRYFAQLRRAEQARERKPWETADGRRGKARE